MLARLLVVSLATSPAWFPPAIAQEIANWELLLSTDATTGPSPTVPTSTFGPVTGSADGGWAAAAELTPSRGVHIPAIFGVLDGTTGAAPGVLRQGALLGGFNQREFRSPFLAHGELTYLAVNGGGAQAIFHDDQLVARQGDTIPTTTEQWDWFSFYRHFADGRVWVAGRSMNDHDFLVEMTSGQIVAATGDLWGGATSPCVTVGGFDSDLGGTHWAALTDFEVFPSFDPAVIVDGAIYEAAPGYPVRFGEPVPPSVSSEPSRVWYRFFPPHVNAVGDVALAATVGVHNGFFVTPTEEVIVRNGVAIQTRVYEDYSNLSIIEFDDRGSLTTSLLGEVFSFVHSTDVHIDGVPIARQSSTLDSNDDGTPNAHWYTFFDGFSSSVTAGADGSVFFQGLVDHDDGVVSEIRSVVTRYWLAPPKVSVCEGQPNSVGQGASLRALGSHFVALNHVPTFTLAYSGLPAGSLTLPIASKMTGFTPNPGGSQGNLCLGGAIGRFQQHAFAAGANGFGSIVVDLGAIPQPTGAVPAVAGETWFFQAWYRDSSPMGPTSNFSDAVAAELR